MANRTIGPVLAARRGKPGVHLHRIQTPMEVLSGAATTPATSAQYLHPAHAKKMETATETVRLIMSFKDSAEKYMLRFSRAWCSTDVLPIKMDSEVPTATRATRGSR